ncbi:hypothetical protein BX257_3491 [Streptomyces sp. 3212.3]|nr:hypothetical protein BX257_3491 [Streptomyces sp. 3212.3]
MATAAAAPSRSFSLRSERTGRLGPSPARVTVTGGELRASHSGGRDQRAPPPLFRIPAARPRCRVVPGRINSGLVPHGMKPGPTGRRTP